MLSRVADSLYWMSRYLERAEHTVRLIDVNMSLMLDEASTTANLGLERRWKRVLACLGHPAHIEWNGDFYQLTHDLTFSTRSLGGHRRPAVRRGGGARLCHRGSPGGGRVLFQDVLQHALRVCGAEALTRILAEQGADHWLVQALDALLIDDRDAGGGLGLALRRTGSGDDDLITVDR